MVWLHFFYLVRLMLFWRCLFFCARTRHSKCRCCQGIKYGFSIGALCSPSMGPSLSLQIHRHGSVGSQRVLSDVSTKHKIHCEGSQRSGFSGRRCGRSLIACNIISCRSDVVTCGLLGEELPQLTMGGSGCLLRRPHLLAT